MPDVLVDKQGGTCLEYGGQRRESRKRGQRSYRRRKRSCLVLGAIIRILAFMLVR